MLISFKHRGVQLFCEMLISYNEKGMGHFYTNESREPIPVENGDRIERILHRLDIIKNPEDMNIPGYWFRSIKTERKVEYSIAVNENWRITFGFDGQNVIDVNLEEKHDQVA